MGTDYIRLCCYPDFCAALVVQKLVNFGHIADEGWVVALAPEALQAEEHMCADF